MDWQQVAWSYAGLLLATAVAYFVLAERVPVARDAKPASLRERMAPLRNLQVWRFSLYYFLVFGGFIALASWLPRYYMGEYGVDLRTAGTLAASFALTATMLRHVGGVLADRTASRCSTSLWISVCLYRLVLIRQSDWRWNRV